MNRLMCLNLSLLNHQVYLPSECRQVIIEYYKQHYHLIKNSIPREFHLFKTSITASGFTYNLTANSELINRGNKYCSLMPYAPPQSGGFFKKTLTLYNNASKYEYSLQVCLNVEWSDMLNTWEKVYKMGDRIQFNLFDSGEIGYDENGVPDGISKLYEVKCWAEVHNNHVVFQSDYNYKWDGRNKKLINRYQQTNIKIKNSVSLHQ